MDGIDFLHSVLLPFSPSGKLGYCSQMTRRQSDWSRYQDQQRLLHDQEVSIFVKLRRVIETLCSVEPETFLHTFNKPSNPAKGISNRSR